MFGILAVIGCRIWIDVLGVLGPRQITAGNLASHALPLPHIARPDIDNSVEAAGCHPFAVRAEGHAMDGAIVGLEIERRIAGIDPDVTVTDSPVFTGIRKAGPSWL
jgi:hypothetical protein